MDSRLSVVLHVLIHMAEHQGPLTSEALAKANNTNPVVIRRVMAGLREQGFVRSEKGHGGGWTLVCDAATVMLTDVYEAIGAPPLLAVANRTESPTCLVEQSVNAALLQAYRDAQEAFRSRLHSVSLADLSADVQERIVARGSRTDLEAIHG